MPPTFYGWCACAVALVGLSAFFLWASEAFSYDYFVMQMPIRGLIAGLVAGGVVFLGAAGLTVLDARRATLIAAQGMANAGGARSDSPPSIAADPYAVDPYTADPWQARTLWIVFVTGLAARCLLLGSEPALEDDYQRYLWDGAVTVAGLNPYAFAPDDAMRAIPPGVLAGLAADAGVVLERVNHPHLKTIYPPVAQGAFALAHLIAPFSLFAWKVVCLAADVATFALLLALLQAIGRPAIWVTLYWWNPIVLKELFNSGHMEAVLVPFVLGGVLLALRGRPLAATGALGLAAGIKVWPVLLLPLIWQGLLRTPGRLAACVVLTVGLLMLWAWPVVLGGLDKDSGFVAYAQKWQTNSALYPALADVAKALLGDAVAITDEITVKSSNILRAGLAGLAGLVALGLAIGLWRRGSLDLARRGGVSPAGAEEARAFVTACGVLAITLWLLSPAQFPWYAVWALMFAPLLPSIGLVIAAITLPFYYAAFHLTWQSRGDLFSDVIVWWIWAPIWLGLALDLLLARRRAHVEVLAPVAPVGLSGQEGQAGQGAGSRAGLGQRFGLRGRRGAAATR